MLNKDVAICLRKVDYSETSQIVTLLCRESGKLSGIAKGSRRKKSSFNGAIEILSFGDIIYAPPKQTGSLATITEFDQRPTFIALRRQLHPMNCALFAAELTDKFTEEADPHSQLFDSLIQYLQDLQSAEDDTAATRMLVIFQLTLLGEIGSRLVLNRCANCSAAFNESWPRVYFTSEAHGLICPDCEISYPDKIRISRSTAQCMADLQRVKHAEPAVINEIERILVRHFTELLHKPPRMAKFFI